MPDYLQISDCVVNVLFIVPAFYLEAHIKKCKPLFSPRFSRWLTQTEFEAIERIWAILNGIASSTREMRPGHQRDTIDDFCGHANWMKTIKLDSSLLRKLVVTIPAVLDHRAALRGFEENLGKEAPAVFASWVRMYEDWEEGEDKALDMTEQVFKGRRSEAEAIPLYLPSSLPPKIRAETCSGDLMDAERQLHEAEAFNALESL
ncbi:uncharacterized protein STEHIDRAFT_160719 [Stereum hirsutum FP-91666 SS1]|uniref:uncharacterized protein n=1 Tax=Stereum hirsutum (strain FP-91666) TaxID=721885 RepID=UPI0004449F3B|nr:uncharacterized protein STEHIDRAFT_160719 [Stereum hirsutum FP-91666 SS1]EIM83118.1 hypothetical protein STEHIDRAFT_160719 [Stereum hirsutum FP-91666 SS1]